MTGLALAAAKALGLALTPTLGVAQERDSFRVAWSIYLGWMPLGHPEESGIMDRWAECYGVDLGSGCTPLGGFNPPTCLTCARRPSCRSAWAAGGSRARR